MGIIWDISTSCYGTDMELYEIRSIPIERAEKLHGIAMGPNHIISYGRYMELYEIRSIPIERAEKFYGIAMGPNHTITILYIVWEIYGTLRNT